MMGQWAPPDVVSAARSGQIAAIEALLTAVWPGCFRLAVTVIGDRALAQDAAQEACAIVYRKIGSVRSDASFNAWLYRIVMREASRVRRRHRIDTPSVELLSAVEDTATLDIWRALATLSPDLPGVA